MSKTTANLRDRLSMELNDYHHGTVTTAIAASTQTVDTGLLNVKGGTTEDYLRDWFILFTSQNNSGTQRIVKDYDVQHTTLNVQGGNLTSDVAALATYELHRFNPTLKLRALNQAARDVYPQLFRHVKDRTLITGNWLPNAHFEDWAASTNPDFYIKEGGVTATESTTYPRGGSSSVLVTATGNAKGIYIHNLTYPRLLDLAGQSIDFKCWAFSATATDDAYIEVYTQQADASGTTTTTVSTTSTPTGSGWWRLLTITSLAIPNDLQYISFRFKCTTANNTVYFDDARVISGSSIYQHVLPDWANDGHIKQLNLQANAYQMGTDMDACDDIGENNKYTPVDTFNTIDDGTYKYLRLPALPNERRLELLGIAPLEDTLSADTDTMTIDDPYTNALIYKAAANLYRMVGEPASMTSKNAYETEIARYEAMYAREMLRKPLTRPSGRVRFV